MLLEKVITFVKTGIPVRVKSFAIRGEWFYEDLSKMSKSITISAVYNPIPLQYQGDSRQAKDYERRVLNKVLCQFINRLRTLVPKHKLTDFIYAKAWFDVWTFKKPFVIQIKCQLRIAPNLIVV